MKFLIAMKTKPTNPPMPPEQTLAILQASKEHTNARLQDGTFDCAYGYLTGDGFCVANYDSHTALMEDLMSYPQFPLMEWDVTPLVDSGSGYDKWIEYFKKQTG